jgi:hypothetical protein
MPDVVASTSQSAIGEARLQPGLAFNKRPQRGWRGVLALAIATPVTASLTLIGFRALVGEPVFSATELWLAPVVLCTTIASMLSYHYGGHPQVVVEEDGLRVKNRLIRFEQIRAIEARKVSTSFAVVTIADGDRTGRLTLFAPCASVQYREILFELAARAGIELTLKPEVKERSSRIPRAKVPVHG